MAVGLIQRLANTTACEYDKAVQMTNSQWVQSAGKRTIVREDAAVDHELDLAVRQAGDALRAATSRTARVRINRESQSMATEDPKSPTRVTLQIANLPVNEDGELLVGVLDESGGVDRVVVAGHGLRQVQLPRRTI